MDAKRRIAAPVQWLLALLLAASLPVQAHEGHHAKPARAAPLAMDAAFSPSGELWIVGLDEQAQLFVQTSSDEGRSWAQPRKIDTGDDSVAAEGESRPKIAFGPGGRVVITYTRPLSKPYTGEIRMLRSGDGGRSFSAPTTVHRDRQLITHRFDSVAFDGHGTLHTLWIDKRDAEASRAEGRTDYRGAAVYRNESKDGGQTFGPDVKLADSSCECCRIALAPAPDGGLVAMWRHVFAPNQRDHAFARIGHDPGPADPTRATFDRWALDACPHHGPSLAPAASGGYHAVWFGDKAGVVGVRYGRLASDGTPRGEPLTLPDESAEHADVQSAGPHVVLAWRSFDGQATRWRAWISHDDGRSFALKELGSSTGDNDYPRLARRGKQIFALWRTTRGVQVERVIP
jgi:hypothetical protein